MIRKLILWIKSKIKKIKNIMFNEEKLINYKQNFTGVKFQWIKPDDPARLGKVVTCRDVFPKGNNIVAKFDDGSECFADQITKNLLMIQGDMPPLSKEEVASIYSPRRSAPNNIATEPSTSPPPAAASAPGRNQAPPQKKEDTEVNPFKMFSTEETDLSIKLKINLPDKKLLKLMYNSAEDKKKFLDQLSSFVLSMINNKVVTESMLGILEPKPIVKKNKPARTTKKTGVKVTEIKNG